MCVDLDASVLILEELLAARVVDLLSFFLDLVLEVVLPVAGWFVVLSVVGLLRCRFLLLLEGFLAASESPLTCRIEDKKI